MAARSYPKAGPASDDLVGFQPLHYDQLAAFRGTRDEPNRTARHAELGREDPDQRLVRGAFDGWCRHPNAERAVDHAVDSVGCRSRGESDGEPNLVSGQDAYRTRISAKRTSNTIVGEKSTVLVLGSIR